MNEDTVITPADPTNTVTTTSDTVEVVQSLLSRVEVSLERLQTAVDSTESRPILPVIPTSLIVAHWVISEDNRSINLDPRDVDIYILTTTPNTNSFINIVLNDLRSVAPNRHNTTIINKGPGMLILVITNTIDAIPITRNKVLKPYRRYELSIIDDGAHVLIS